MFPVTKIIKFIWVYKIKKHITLPVIFYKHSICSVKQIIKTVIYLVSSSGDDNVYIPIVIICPYYNFNDHENTANSIGNSSASANRRRFRDNTFQ